MKRLLTARELGEALNVTRATIYRLRANGEIRAYKVRTQIRFDLDEVKEDLRRSERTVELRPILRSGGPRRRGTDSIVGAGASAVELGPEEEDADVSDCDN